MKRSTKQSTPTISVAEAERIIAESKAQLRREAQELEAFQLPEPEPEPKNLIWESRARLLERLAHARDMHRKALTRVKRSQTIERKWRRRLKALERRAAKS